MPSRPYPDLNFHSSKVCCIQCSKNVRFDHMAYHSQVDDTYLCSHCFNALASMEREKANSILEGTLDKLKEQKTNSK